MIQRIVLICICSALPAIGTGLWGCSNDHKEESRELAVKLSEELIQQQMKTSGDTASDDRVGKIEAELSKTGLTAEEVRMMLDTIQHRLTKEQEQSNPEKKEKNNGKPDSTSH